MQSEILSLQVDQADCDYVWFSEDAFCEPECGQYEAFSLGPRFSFQVSGGIAFLGPRC